MRRKPHAGSPQVETDTGVYKSFTSLDDERIFLDYNTRAVFAHIHAVEALLPVLLKSLRKLADLRAAAERDDIPSRYRDVQTIRAALC